MAKSYEVPPGVDIAALRGKNKSTAVNLMLPGEGTPWEDRGNLGLLKAFTFMVRWVAPIAILLVMLNGLGVFGG